MKGLFGEVFFNGPFCFVGLWFCLVFFKGFSFMGFGFVGL